MFEDEVAMEKRSSIFPLLLMLCLAAVVAGGVAWVVLEVKARAVLTVEQVARMWLRRSRGRVRR